MISKRLYEMKKKHKKVNIELFENNTISYLVTFITVRQREFFYEKLLLVTKNGLYMTCG